MVIGIEPQWTNRVVEGIAETGKPVTGFAIERYGEIKTVEMASWKAKEYMHWASELRREECDLSEIWVSTKCGESDTTTVSCGGAMGVPRPGSGGNGRTVRLRPLDQKL